jgi:hypothetical protein
MSRKLFVIVALSVIVLGLVPVTSNAGVPGCPPAEERTWTEPSSFRMKGPAVLHLWWNNSVPPWGQEQVRVKLRSGRVSFFDAMGQTWKYVNNRACLANLNDEFDNSDLRVVRVGRLVNLGLAKWR